MYWIVHTIKWKYDRVYNQTLYISYSDCCHVCSHSNNKTTKKIFSVTIYRILLSDETTVSLLPTLKCHLYKHQVGGSISMAPLVFGIDRTLCTRPCSETNLKIVAKTYYVMSHVNAHRNYPQRQWHSQAT